MAVVAALVAAAAARSGGDVAKADPRGDVKAKGLSARERSAIDIVRVEATGGTFGAIVTVTFAGSLEAAIGRGKLTDGIAGIVLRPRSGRPTLVATRGPGVRGDDGGTGGRGPFAVVRQGRTLTFIARNVDFTRIRRLEARTYAALVRPRRTTQGNIDIFLFARAVASRQGEDFWAAENAEVKPEDRCRILREELAKAKALRDELDRDVKRALARGRRTDAKKLAEDRELTSESISDLERDLEEACKPPAVDFGCQTIGERAPRAPDHHFLGLRLCNRTVDHVEIATSAPFQRSEPQAIVVSSAGFRQIPVTVTSNRTIAIPIQPPMQTTEQVSLAVQGLPTGTRVEFTPYQSGTAGEPTAAVLP